MSSVDRKLCDEIQTSDHNSHEDVYWTTERSRPQDRLNSKTSKPDVGSRSKKSIVIERQKTINNLQKDSGIEKQFRSKEIITRKYKPVKQIAVSTVKSGTSKCETDCVTIVRARDRDHKHCVCKSKRIADFKNTQTDDPHYANKACCGCIEMTTCSTQMDMDLPLNSKLLCQEEEKIRKLKADSQSNNYNLPNINKLMVNKELREIFNTDININQREYEYGRQIPQYSHEMGNSLLNKENKPCRCSQLNNNKCGSQWEASESNRYSQSSVNNKCKGKNYMGKTQNYMGARKWALSKYLSRGPDF